MPIYEYQCTACNKDFEALVRSSGPRPECPVCKSVELRKKLSSFSAVMGSSASQQALPASCQSCPNAAGPGACGLN